MRNNEIERTAEPVLIYFDSCHLNVMVDLNHEPS